MNMQIQMTTATSPVQPEQGVSMQSPTVAQALVSPAELRRQMPLAAAIAARVEANQRAVQAVVRGDDERLLVVVGPCSIHDPDAAYDYGRRLSGLAAELDDQLLLVMRAYYEKPRTTVGWKGLLYDPAMNGEHNLAEGVRMARAVSLELAGMGLPLATEALSPLAVPYLSDLLSWVAIGARTTESQTHREMASGLPCAVGFKNGTDGSMDVALHAMQSASAPHCYLGMSDEGVLSMVQSSGNAASHMVLRGGNGQPNYHGEALQNALQSLTQAGQQRRLMIDCSHENSGKCHIQQAEVARHVGEYIGSGAAGVMGIMLESHINEGKQPLGADLDYGVSITDACMGWAQTEAVLRQLHAAQQAGSRLL